MSDNRFDPFGDDDLQQDIASFKPKPKRAASKRPQEEDLDKLAEARGFNDRTPAPRKAAKEPLKPLQFRLPESVIQEFHQLAYEEFGLKHGAKTALFLKLWEEYRASKS